MNKSDTQYLKTIQEQLSCRFEGCGVRFTLEISEFDFQNLPEKSQKYNGRCSGCHSHLMVKGSDLEKFIRTMGSPKIVKIKNNFDQLYDTE